MDRKKGIIIFTKNRPQKLSKTLPQIVNVDLPVIVLDDSGDSKSKQVVKSISKRSENIHYHGKIEQRMILQKLKSHGYFRMIKRKIYGATDGLEIMKEVPKW